MSGLLRGQIAEHFRCCLARAEQIQAPPFAPWLLRMQPLCRTRYSLDRGRVFQQHYTRNYRVASRSQDTFSTMTARNRLEVGRMSYGNQPFSFSLHPSHAMAVQPTCSRQLHALSHALLDRNSDSRDGSDDGRLSERGDDEMSENGGVTYAPFRSRSPHGLVCLNTRLAFLSEIRLHAANMSSLMAITPTTRRTNQPTYNSEWRSRCGPHR